MNFAWRNKNKQLGMDITDLRANIQTNCYTNIFTFRKFQ